MKIIAITTIYYLFVNITYSQAFSFIGKNKKSIFKYEYNFKFDNIDDTSSFTIIKKYGNNRSTILLNNNEGASIPLSLIKIINSQTKIIYETYSDIDGKAEIQLLGGNYFVEITENHSDTFIIDISLQPNEYFNLSVKVGLAPELYNYMVHSKSRLDSRKMISIMKCVKLNRNDFNENCSDKKRYIISKQI
jgi:hypothetical protein